jgi:hypothetical protein
MRHQPLLARIAFAGFLLGSLIALIACGGTKLHVWNLDVGLQLLNPGLAVGLVGLGSGGAWIWRALAMNNSLGWRLGGIGLLGSAILIGIPANYLWRVYTLPPIHDISTDIGDAPQFVTLLGGRQGAPNPARYDGSDMVTYQGERMTTALAQKNTWPDIKPLEQLSGRAQHDLISKFFWRALNAANAMGWQVASYDERQGRIEATNATLWFGTISDIVIRLKPAGKIGVRIDIRAKSRVGVSDAGHNAALIRDFLEREMDH